MTISTAESRAAALRALDGAGVPYALYDHAPAFTITDCLTLPFIGGGTVVCKNVFLTNRQKTAFYLMLLPPDAPFRTAAVSRQLGVSRLSFAPEALLPDMLGLSRGAVSPLGLLFDRERRVTLLVERALLSAERLAFHPCDNAASVVIDSAAFFSRVLPDVLGVTPVFVD